MPCGSSPTAQPADEGAGFNRVLTDNRQRLGEAYLPVFVQGARRLLCRT
jgi:hypothetical protein